MRAERRRTDRVILTYPVIVRGVDDEGNAVEWLGRTLSVNRHGARVQVAPPLPGGTIVRVANPAGRREADFRVVGLVSPLPDGGGVYGVLGPLLAQTMKGRGYGVECVDPEANFWGIHFPPLVASENGDARLLLECQQCHRAAPLGLSIVEIDVLENSGTLSWPCDNCKAITSWAQPDKERKTAANRHSRNGNGAWLERRRLPLQIPFRIRRSSGQVELGQSEDVSKSGFSFASETDYAIGEAVLVACPYSGAGASIEVRAQIARRQEVEGVNRKIFGVRYGTLEIASAS